MCHAISNLSMDPKGSNTAVRPAQEQHACGEPWDLCKTQSLIDNCRERRFPPASCRMKGTGFSVVFWPPQTECVILTLGTVVNAQSATATHQRI